MYGWPCGVREYICVQNLLRTLPNCFDADLSYAQNSSGSRRSWRIELGNSNKAYNGPTSVNTKEREGDILRARRAKSTVFANFAH